MWGGAPNTANTSEEVVVAGALPFVGAEGERTSAIADLRRKVRLNLICEK
jgi:hypothetical protein